jgi:predicted nucleic acid-binding protein
VGVLVDTSALVVFLRRRPPPDRRAVGEAAAAEIAARRALVSSVTMIELLVGARDASGEERLLQLLERLPVVHVDRDVAEIAGRMGRFARAAGSTLPLADLQIAATALYLDVPVLTCDSDFGRGVELASRRHRANPWRGFRIHPGSVVD